MDRLNLLLDPFVIASLGACLLGLVIVIGGLHAGRSRRFELRLGAAVLANATIVLGVLTMLGGLGLLIWRFIH